VARYIESTKSIYQEYRENLLQPRIFFGFSRYSRWADFVDYRPGYRTKCVHIAFRVGRLVSFIFYCWRYGYEKCITPKSHMVNTRNKFKKELKEICGFTTCEGQMMIRISADIIYVLYDTNQFCASRIIMSQTRSSIEYLIPSDNIIVIDLHYNLTKKYNLTGRLWYDLCFCTGLPFVATLYIPLSSNEDGKSSFQLSKIPLMS